MNDPIRVLIADDSTVVRRIVADTLQKTPGVEVVGAARNGEVAMQLKAETNPDVVLLDVEMPVMNGIRALKEIRSTDSTTPVIMFSSLTARGAESTLEALSLGASDYVTKPVSATTIHDSIRYIEKELVPTVLQWGRQIISRRSRPVVIRSKSASTPVARTPQVARVARQPIDVIAIGSSTGGPNALTDVLSKLPADLAVPVVIVQHMPTLFTKMLAERLDRVCALKVQEGYDDALVRPGQVWIAPGDYHMTTESHGGQVRLKVHQGPKENSCRPAVDTLFRSVGQCYGGKSLAVILTGMGKDGTEGCRALKAKGTHVIAQDEASCVVWGMPRAVTEAGLADSVLPLSDISSEIIQHVRGRRHAISSHPRTRETTVVAGR